MKEVFKLKEPSYSLRSKGNYFGRGNVKTTHYGIQSNKYLAPEIWDLVSDQIEYCGSLTKFKHFIKSLSPGLSLSAMQNIYCISRLHLIKHNNEIK